MSWEEVIFLEEHILRPKGLQASTFSESSAENRQIRKKVASLLEIILAQGGGLRRVRHPRDQVE